MRFHRRLALAAAGVLAMLAPVVGVSSASATAPAAATASAAATAAAVARAADGSYAVSAPSRAGGWASANADEASSFHVTVVANADGSIRVTEAITWVFPSGVDRHGIERFIQTAAGWSADSTKYRAYPISDVTASSPSGAPADVSLSDSYDSVRIRVGNPDETVQGTQRYLVSYTLGQYVNDIGDGTAEVYYNIIGSSNTSSYRDIAAKLTAPVAATKAACFYGQFGSTTACTATVGPVATTYTAPDVSPGEGVSVLASYPRTAFGDLTPDLQDVASAGDGAGGAGGSYAAPQPDPLLNGLLGGVGLFAPVLAGAAMGALVWRRGRDETYAGLTPGLSPGLGQESSTQPAPRNAPVVVQFTPPLGVQPGMVGTVMDETANVVDVTGTLIDLAVRGYVTIGKVDASGLWRKDDWELTRIAPPATAAPLAAYEQQLLDGVFLSGDVVRLSELKNSFAGTLRSVQSSMYDEVVRRGWFRRSPESQRSGWQFLGTALAMGGIFVAVLLPVIGYGKVALGVGMVVAGIVVRVLGGRMAARTAEGSAVLAQSRGFEEYLKTAEAGQIRWEEAQDIFSRYLPYAIVYGVADRWARVFDEVAAAAAAAGHVVGAPIWYAGAWDPSWGFGSLASSMDDFSTTAAGTFVATPGSSGSSGFSSGGGFSGGGGGGSSGGSW